MMRLVASRLGPRCCGLTRAAARARHFSAEVKAAGTVPAPVRRCLPQAWWQLQHHQQLLRQQRRQSSSGGRGGKPPTPPLEGLPFDIDLTEAAERFRSFCKTKGITPGLAVNNVFRGRPPTSYDSVTAAFVPFWAFDCNVRTLAGATTVRETRTGYSEASMVYGGYAYHRTLLQHLPSTLLGATPFDPRWLTASRVGLPVQVDTWGVYQFTAWAAARHAVSDQEQRHVREAYGGSLPGGANAPLRCEFALHAARRVMLPVFVFEYRFFGETFHVFVSGRRSGPEAAGIDHGNMTATIGEGARTFGERVDRHFQEVMRVLQGATGTPLGRVAGTFLGRFLVFAVGTLITASRVIVVRFPLFWPLAIGGFVFFRKVYSPLRAHRESWEAWAARAREELERQAAQGDVWVWSDEYRARAQSQRAHEAHARAGARRASQSRAAREAAARLDTLSPSELLGVAPGAGAAELTAAFRREMLRWHPDMQAGKSEEEKAYALARTQALTRAYRILRNK